MIAIIKINNFPIGKPSKKKSIPINKIISSSAQTRNGETYLLLDQPLTNATNTDYFVLRRFAPDPSNIIIEGIKPSGSTGAGTITPLYISQQLQNSMSDIVSKLNSENTI